MALTRITSKQVTYKQGGTGSVVRSLEGKLQEYVSVLDFVPSVIVTQSVDCSTYIQAALNIAEGKTLYLDGRTYRCDSYLQVKGNVEGNNTTLMFYGTVASGPAKSLVYQEDKGSLRNFTIDGTNVEDVGSGLFVNTDFAQDGTCYYELTIQNISTNSTADQTTNGAVFFKASDASVNLNSDLDIRLRVENVVANGDGGIGDNRGSATGILVSFNGTGTASRVNIHDCYVFNVSSGATPAEDSSGINTYTGDFQVFGSKGVYTISNCDIKQCYKRAVKVQSQNTLIENVVADATSTEGAFETYAFNTTFHKCSSLNSSNVAFSTNWRHTTFSDCYVHQVGNDRAVRLYSNSSDTFISKLRILTSSSYASNDIGILDIDTPNPVTIDNVIINCTTDTGSAITITSNASSADIIISNVQSTGTYYGLHSIDAQGTVKVNNSVFRVANAGVYRTGNTGTFIFDIAHSEFSGGLQGALTYHSLGASSCILNMDSCRLSASANGIVGASGSRITNNVITQSPSGTTGYGITAGNSVIRGNQITDFAYSLEYNYTTTAEVANNVGISPNTALAEKTGYTPFVENDNYTR